MVGYRLYQIADMKRIRCRLGLKVNNSTNTHKIRILFLLCKKCVQKKRVTLCYSQCYTLSS
jgi:hypothetical protein